MIMNLLAYSLKSQKKQVSADRLFRIDSRWSVDV